MAQTKKIKSKKAQKKYKKQKQKKLDEKLHHAKDVAFYSAKVNAWVSTKQESSKYLLNLSAAGIGLLVTLAMTLKNINIVLFVLASSSFLVCVIATLLIFNFNAKYLEAVLQKTTTHSCLLKILDWASYISFGAGLILTFWIGLLTLPLGE